MANRGFSLHLRAQFVFLGTRPKPVWRRSFFPFFILRYSGKIYWKVSLIVVKGRRSLFQCSARAGVYVA